MIRLPRLSAKSRLAGLNAIARSHTRLAALFIIVLSSLAAQAQEPLAAPDATTSGYTTIVIFGDSLSDTGNIAHLSEAKYRFKVPSRSGGDYTAGRFTDGADTSPAAEKYFGIWLEQFAASLPARPRIKDSLDGGTDYAYGYATTGNGRGELSFGPFNAFSVPVDNIGQQITDYLATHPKITTRTLFAVWGGSIDILNATTNDQVIDAGMNQTLNIKRLIEAGATQFIVPNLPPLGLIPRLNTSASNSAAGTKASVLYNTTLTNGISLLRENFAAKHIAIAKLDVYTLFNKVAATPSKYALKNVKVSSQDKSVNPDTYLFWDSLHPTTRGHNILAVAAEQLLKSGAVAADALSSHDKLSDQESIDGCDETCKLDSADFVLRSEHGPVIHE